MATIIDALIVKLGLDATDFEKGQKRAAEAWTKTRDQATKSGSQVEESARKAADAVNLITRRVLELFAVFTGSRALSDFVGKLDAMDATLGRFASALGQSPQRVAAWENAAERFGGSAGATAATLERVNKMLFDLNKNGQMLPREFSQLQAWTGMRIDPNHGVDRFLSDTAAALQRLHQIDPSSAHNVAQALGIDPGTEQLMYRMGRGINAYLDTLQKSLSPSDQAIKAAQELQERWRTLEQQVIALANVMMEKLGPVLLDVIDRMSKWVDKNKEWIQSKIVEAINNFKDYLASIDWQKVKSGLDSFVAGAIAVKDAVGGIIKATEILFGLWLGAKFLQALANLRLLATAGTLGASGGVGAAIAGLLGLAAAIKYAGSHVRDDPHAGERGGISGWIMDHLRKSSETTVDGRPVSKSNPMPVTNADQQPEGGGFWSTLGSAIGGFFKGIGSGSSLSGGMLDALKPGHGGASGGWGNGGASGSWDPGSFSGDPGTSGRGNAKMIMDYLIKERGWTPAAAAIAAAQAKAESNFNPAASGDPSIPGGSHGLFQWNRDRLDALKRFGGDHWRDFNVQLEFFAREAEKMIPNWKNQTDLSHASSIGKLYEGYAGPIQLKRAATAAAYLDAYQSTAAAAYAQNLIGAHAAALSSIGSTHTATTSNTAVTNHIGDIHVHTQATNADGVAADIDQALRRKLFTSQANYGLA